MADVVTDDAIESWLRLDQMESQDINPQDKGLIYFHLA